MYLSEAESEGGATSQLPPATSGSPSSSPGDKLPYQLPVAELEKSGGKVMLEREVEVCTLLIWALSTVQPLIYFGQKDTGKLQPDAKV